MRTVPIGHYYVLAGFASESAYPKWIRPYLILVVSVVWLGMSIASVVVPTIEVPTAVHIIMGIVVLSLFTLKFSTIELPGIKLDSRKDSDEASN